MWTGLLVQYICLCECVDWTASTVYVCASVWTGLLVQYICLCECVDWTASTVYMSVRVCGLDC